MIKTHFSPTTGESSPMPISVRVRQASQLTGLSVSLLYKLMAGGSLPYSKVGAARLILVADLFDFVNRAHTEAHPTGKEA